MTHGLAPVFVNDQRIEDFDEPTLTVADIVRSYGRDPGGCIVYRLNGEDDGRGRRVDMEERVDLAHEEDPVFFRCELRRTEATAPGRGGGVRRLQSGRRDPDAARPQALGSELQEPRRRVRGRGARSRPDARNATRTRSAVRRQ